MKKRWTIAATLVVAVALWRTLLFVDEAEVVIVTQFGRPVRTLEEAGLYFKLPWQSALRIDRRLQIYDPRPSEFLAKQKKSLDLDVFVLWRVADPQRFLETVNDMMGAQSRLHDLVWSELAAQLGQTEVEALLSTEAEGHRLDELVGTLTSRCAEAARSSYGLEVVAVRLKRIAYPTQVRDSVFRRMRAERARLARQYRAEGEEEALKIRAGADKDRTVLLATARAEAEKIRGTAEARAARVYAEAHALDPEFYEFLRSLEAYEKFLDEKTTLLLSGGSDLLKYLERLPPARLETGASAPAGTAASAPAGAGTGAAGGAD